MIRYFAILMALLSGGCGVFFRNPVHATVASAEKDADPRCAASGLAVYSQIGAGSARDPYLLCTRTQLLSLMAATQDLDKGYRLGQSIDLSGLNQASGVHPIGSQSGSAPFTGAFDGGGYSISHLTYSGGGDAIGLFSSLGSGAVIQDVLLDSVSLVTTDASPVGAIAGAANSLSGTASVRRCTISGSVAASMGAAVVGGMIGMVPSSATLVLSSSTSSASVSNPASSAGIGGLVGECDGDCDLSHSSSTGSLTGQGAVGGILGHCSGAGNCFVSGCSRSGAISASGAAVGGIIGLNDLAGFASVVACSYTGQINAAGGVGGIMGSLSGSRNFILDSYASGSVASSSARVGGLVGVAGQAHLTVLTSYAAVDVSAPGDSGSGGLIGRIEGNNGQVFVDQSFTTGTVDCTASTPAFVGKCGRVLGDDQGLGSLTAFVSTSDFSGSFLSNANGFLGVNADPSGVSGEGAVSWFYDSSNTPLSGWDFSSIWQSHVGSAMPTLRGGVPGLLGERFPFDAASADGNHSGSLVAQQAVVVESGTLRSLSIYIASASGKIRLGLYDSSGPSGGPGALLANTVEVTGTVGWTTIPVTTPTLIAPGIYWLAFATNDNALQVELTLSSGSLANAVFTYGALPSVFPASPATGTGHWSFYGLMSP